MDFKYTLSQTLWLGFLLAVTAQNDVAMDLSVINIRGKLKEGIFVNADRELRLLGHSVWEITFSQIHKSPLKMN